MSRQFEKVGDGLLVRAPGKINLSLLVAGKRADGFHDIESIMAKIDWYDEILIERQKAEGRRENIELICKGEYKVPEGEENLVYKAAKIILDCGLRIADLSGNNAEQRTQNAERRTGGIKITLTKNLPVGSGLGSGSSDAAATLLGLNKLLRMGLNQKKLAGLAAKLGSDVAFFLDGPMAFCTGKGEKVKKLEECEFRGLLFAPAVSVSTARVYENYRHDEVEYRRLSGEINTYIAKKRLDLICKMCTNMLQESCFELHPYLGVLKKRIESFGIGPVCLSGSGSSMFCIINDGNEEGVRKYTDELERDFGCRSVFVNNNGW
jgi:4-diphosphocytidyl-2-C-methyl-D-erythritol kinase